MSAMSLTEKNFEAEVLKADQPVLVDFWATWCGPCRMLSPIVDEIAEEMAGKIKVAKVNVDEAQELAAQYNIMSIPTLLIFKKGELVDQMIGVNPKDRIAEKIKSYL